MPTFDVTVQGKQYEVDAPDVNTAWHWANQTHAQSSMKVAPELQAARNAEAANLDKGLAPNGGPAIPTSNVVGRDAVPAVQNVNTSAPPQPATKPAQPTATPAESVAGNPFVRFAIGTGAPAFAAKELVDHTTAQLAPTALQTANLPRDDSKGFLGPNTRHGSKIEDLIKAGREADDSQGPDFARIGGEVMNPANLAMGGPVARALLQRVGQGMKLGAASAVNTPVGESGDFAGTKAAQIAGSTAAGAALPVVSRVAGNVASNPVAIAAFLASRHTPQMLADSLVRYLARRVLPQALEAPAPTAAARNIELARQVAERTAISGAPEVLNNR